LKNGNHHNKGGHSAGKSRASASHQGEGIERRLHNPIEDRLIPLQPLDLAKVKSVDDLVRAMAKTASWVRRPTCSKPWPATKNVSS